MKKLSLVLAIILLLSFAGCSKNDEMPENIESSSVPSNAEETQASAWQYFYKAPNDLMISTPASENNLEGALVYFECTIKDTEQIENATALFVENNEYQKWIAVIFEPFVPPNVGDSIVVYGAYQGLSGNFDNLPIIFTNRYTQGEKTKDVMPYITLEQDSIDLLSEQGKKYLEEELNYYAIDKGSRLVGVANSDNAITVHVIIASPDPLTEKQAAELIYSRISEYLLENPKWESIAVDFTGLGTVALHSSQAIEGEVGNYFETVDIINQIDKW